MHHDTASRLKPHTLGRVPFGKKHRASNTDDGEDEQSETSKGTSATKGTSLSSPDGRPVESTELVIREGNSPVKIEGIIFDSDGTLVDSETLSARAISQILFDNGAPVAVDEVLEHFRGCRFALFAQSLLQDYPVMDVEAFTREFRIRNVGLFSRELQPMNGAVELVSAIAIEKCVASNGPRDKIEQCLGVTGLLPYFADRIASAYEVQSWKPDPGLIVHASSMMGVTPNRCLLVENSIAGVQAGLEAGVFVVGYRLSTGAQAALGHRVPVIQELAQLHDYVRTV